MSDIINFAEFKRLREREEDQLAPEMIEIFAACRVAIEVAAEVAMMLANSPPETVSVTKEMRKLCAMAFMDGVHEVLLCDEMQDRVEATASIAALGVDKSGDLQDYIDWIVTLDHAGEIDIDAGLEMYRELRKRNRVFRRDLAQRRL